MLIFQGVQLKTVEQKHIFLQPRLFPKKGALLFKLQQGRDPVAVVGHWSFGTPLQLGCLFWWTWEVYWVVVSNIFYFHPYLGKIPILTNIFQMGCNHQLVYISLEILKCGPPPPKMIQNGNQDLDPSPKMKVGFRRFFPIPAVNLTFRVRDMYKVERRVFL